MTSPGGSSGIIFSLPQKGKSVFLKVSYDCVSDKRLAQRAWQQLQTDCHTPSHASTAVAETLDPATQGAPDEAMPPHIIAAALQLIKPPEWHKNGATLRLPDGEPNAAEVLAAIARAFKSVVERLREEAAESDADAAAAPPLEESASPSPVPQPAPPQPAPPQPAPLQPAPEQERAEPLRTPVTKPRDVARAVPSRSSDHRALEASAALPPGVTLSQLSAWE
jgi:hypothetical protein